MFPGQYEKYCEDIINNELAEFDPYQYIAN